MKIHPTTLEYENTPGIIGLLDSNGFFWFIVLVTVSTFIWAIWKLWKLHSLPKYQAKDKGYSQGRLVFWLCMIGLFVKPLWILAIILVVIDWDALRNWLRGGPGSPAS